MARRKLKATGIGPEIARARKAAGLTQADLAARIGCFQPHLSDLESGKIQPTWTTVCRIADGLGLSVSYDGTSVTFYEG